MRKVLIFCSLIALGILNSCNGPEEQPATKSGSALVSSDFTLNDGRMVFKNEEDLIKVSNSLLETSTEDFKEWESSIGFKSHFGLKDNLELPPLLFKVTNAAGEYQVGDNIVWISEDGFSYMFKETHLDMLSEIKASPSKFDFVEKYPYTIKKDLIELNGNNLKTNSQSVNAKYQYTFSSGGHSFKMVFELVRWCGKLSGSLYSDVYVADKLEYYNGGWQHAGEVALKTIQGLEAELTKPYNTLGIPDYFDLDFCSGPNLYCGGPYSRNDNVDLVIMMARAKVSSDKLWTVANVRGDFFISTVKPEKTYVYHEQYALWP